MFYILLREQNITKKRWINEFIHEFKIGKNKEYKVNTIKNSAVYTRKADKHLLELYYLTI